MQAMDEERGHFLLLNMLHRWVRAVARWLETKKLSSVFDYYNKSELRRRQDMWDSTEISMNLVTRAFYLGLEDIHTYIHAYKTICFTNYC